MTDFARLIPELPDWNDGRGIDVDAWLSCIGRFDHAVAYATLFWPAFTLHDDCVLFADFRLESFDGFMRQTGGKRPAVEAVMNHRHILDLFSCQDGASEEVILHLGRALRDIWSCKLQRDFPNRRFIVSFPEDTVDDLIEYEVTFYQPRQEG